MYIIIFLFLCSVYGYLFYPKHRHINYVVKCFIKCVGLISPVNTLVCSRMRARGDKILLVSNHVNLVDFIHIHNFVNVTYPNHLPVFIAVDKIKKIPLYGKILSEHYILINRRKADMRTFLAKCQKYNDKKVIMIIFPEGDIYSTNNKQKSDRWEIKINSSHRFNNLLYPKIKGLYAIIETFKPDNILLSVMIYNSTLFKNYNDFINPFILIPNCFMGVVDCEKIRYNTDLFMDMWKRVDNLLD